MSLRPDQPEPRPTGLPGGSGRTSGRTRLDGAERAERIDELLIDRATQGLDAEQEAELRMLLEQSGRALDESYELLAASLMNAIEPPAEDDVLSVQLRNRILAAGDAWLATRDETLERAVGQSADASPFGRPFTLTDRLGTLQQSGRTAQVQPANSRERVRFAVRLGRMPLINRTSAGWMAAAACLALAVFGWLRPGASPSGTLIADRSPVSAGPAEPSIGVASLESPVDIAADWERFVSENHDDLRLMPLGMTGSALAAIGTQSEPEVGPPVPATIAAAAAPVGEVVWSSARQQGFVRLSGLPPLERPGDQYQLWIVDALRSEAQPISAGVFDVRSGGGQIMLPLRTSVRVDHALRVAITVERSGGAVVPSLDSIVVIGDDELLANIREHGAPVDDQGAPINSIKSLGSFQQFDADGAAAGPESGSKLAPAVMPTAAPLSGDSADGEAIGEAAGDEPNQ